MNSAVLNVRVEPQLKKKARLVADGLGLNLSALVNAYLRQLVRTKTVHFTAAAEEPTEYLLEALRESKKDIKAGRVVSFDDPTDAVAYLSTMIENERKTVKDRLHQKILQAA